MAFACLVAAAAAVAADLPAGAKNPAAQDVGNYTVLYDGPDGSHLQTGEPGKAVKGFYTQVPSYNSCFKLFNRCLSCFFCIFNSKKLMDELARVLLCSLESSSSLTRRKLAKVVMTSQNLFKTYVLFISATVSSTLVEESKKSHTKRMREDTA